jgi:hypothetical protein
VLIGSFDSKVYNKCIAFFTMNHDLRQLGKHNRSRRHDSGLDLKLTGPPVEDVVIDLENNTYIITEVRQPYQVSDQNTSQAYDS